MATTITNVTVFDGVRTVPATAVRIADGVVSALGDADVAAAGDQLHDGRGGTLLPGLIDAHVHLLPGALRQALTFGVATVLDLFSKPELLHPMADEAAASNEMADVRYSSIGATVEGGHPSLMYAPFPTVTGPQDADRFVADRIAEGAAFLKVFYDPVEHSGPLGFPSLDVATVAALATAAHDRGLLAIVHTNSASAVRDVADAGIDVLAHVPIDPLGDNVIDMLADRGIPVIATLATIENVADGAGAELADDPHLGPLLGPRWRACCAAAQPAGGHRTCRTCPAHCTTSAA
ncbi:hypothetical protein BH23ACT10_BH23ACT10_20030 [soil metagenome]